MPPWPWKTPRTASDSLSTNRQIADQAAEGVRLIGHSPAIEALRSIIRRVADTELAVLILGENGTGKEVVAQSIHYLSRRRDKPFIAVNCAAIPETLAESELFGHEKGAFTDAREMRRGKFELAAERHALPRRNRRPVARRSVEAAPRAWRRRCSCAWAVRRPSTPTPAWWPPRTRTWPRWFARSGFARISTFGSTWSRSRCRRLRDRPEDIMLLAEYFLTDFCQKARRKVPAFSAAARSRLESHPWPGNVRELRNLMERLAYLSTEDRIEVEDLAFILSPRGVAPGDAPAVGGPSLAEATAEFQIHHITEPSRSRRATSARPPPGWACTARTSTARCVNSGWTRPKTPPANYYNPPYKTPRRHGIFRKPPKNRSSPLESPADRVTIRVSLAGPLSSIGRASDS